MKIRKLEIGVARLREHSFALTHFSYEEALQLWTDLPDGYYSPHSSSLKWGALIKRGEEIIYRDWTIRNGWNMKRERRFTIQQYAERTVKFSQRRSCYSWLNRDDLLYPLGKEKIYDQMEAIGEKLKSLMDRRDAAWREVYADALKKLSGIEGFFVYRVDGLGVRFNYRNEGIVEHWQYNPNGTFSCVFSSNTMWGSRVWPFRSESPRQALLERELSVK